MLVYTGRTHGTCVDDLSLQRGHFRFYHCPEGGADSRPVLHFPEGQCLTCRDFESIKKHPKREYVNKYVYICPV